MKQSFREMGVEVIRSCVAKWNALMHGIMQRRDYQRIGSYLIYQADAVSAPVEQIAQLAEDEREAVWSFLNSQDDSERPRLFVCRGAKWQALTTEQLSARLRAGLVWGARQGKNWQSLLIQSYMESADLALWVGYIDGTSEGLPVLLQEMRHLAYQQGYSSVGGFFPKTDFTLESLRQTGYQPEPSQEYWVYEAIAPAN
jgi:hypothetical protein